MRESSYNRSTSRSIHHIDDLTRPSHLQFDRLPPSLSPFHNDDLEHAMKNIKRIGDLLIIYKCKSFAKVMIKCLNDQWINGSYCPKLWNMFLPEIM